MHSLALRACILGHFVTGDISQPRFGRKALAVQFAVAAAADTFAAFQNPLATELCGQFPLGNNRCLRGNFTLYQRRVSVRVRPSTQSKVWFFWHSTVPLIERFRILTAQDHPD